MLFFRWLVYGQDTIYQYWDKDYRETTKALSVFNSKTYKIEDHYSCRYAFKDGKICRYQEFTINPFTLNGLAETFNGSSLSSQGKYKSGHLTGIWKYGTKEVNYNSVEEYLSNNMKSNGCSSSNNQIDKGKKANDKIVLDIQTFIENNYCRPFRGDTFYNHKDLKLKFTLDSAGRIKCPEILNCLNLDITYELLRLVFLYQFHGNANVYLGSYVIPVFQKNFVAEQNAKFKGGDIMVFRAWLMQNIYYPSDAKENMVQGEVMVTFVVDQNGKIKDVRLIKSLYPSIDQEVVKVVQKSPYWSPALMDNKPVKQIFSLPVKFQFEK